MEPGKGMEKRLLLVEEAMGPLPVVMMLKKVYEETYEEE
jgi:hypothetical protein